MCLVPIGAGLYPLYAPRPTIYGPGLSPFPRPVLVSTEKGQTVTPDPKPCLSSPLLALPALSSPLHVWANYTLVLRRFLLLPLPPPLLPTGIDGFTGKLGPLFGGELFDASPFQEASIPGLNSTHFLSRAQIFCANSTICARPARPFAQ